MTRPSRERRRRPGRPTDRPPLDTAASRASSSSASMAPRRHGDLPAVIDAEPSATSCSPTSRPTTRRGFRGTVSHDLVGQPPRSLLQPGATGRQLRQPYHRALARRLGRGLADFGDLAWTARLSDVTIQPQLRAVLRPRPCHSPATTCTSARSTASRSAVWTDWRNTVAGTDPRERRGRGRRQRRCPPVPRLRGRRLERRPLPRAEGSTRTSTATYAVDRVREAASSAASLTFKNGLADTAAYAIPREPPPHGSPLFKPLALPPRGFR